MKIEDALGNAIRLGVDEIELSLKDDLGVKLNQRQKDAISEAIADVLETISPAFVGDFPRSQN